MGNDHGWVISFNHYIKMDLQGSFYAEHTLSIQHTDPFHDTTLVDGPYLIRLHLGSLGRLAVPFFSFTSNG